MDNLLHILFTMNQLLNSYQLKGVLGMKVIGLDVGRYRVKAYSNGFKTSFSSYCGSYRSLKLERTMTNEDMVVKWDGRVYFVGEIAKDEADDGVQNFLSTKVTFDTKLLGLVAIHRLVDDGDEIFLTIGHPIANHIQSEKEGMKELFIGTHELTVNDIRKSFTISNVTVLPEGASTQFILPEKHTLAHGIDVGGATTNYCTWEKGRWIDRLSGTLPFGLENKKMNIEQFSRFIINNIAQRINQFNGHIYTIGGAAHLISDSLKQYIKNINISPLEEGSFANAVAYYTIGVKQYEKLQKK